TPAGVGSQTGDLSAIMIGNAPLWSEFFKTPGKEVALLSEWEEKLERITAVCARQNVTSMAGVPSWMMVLLKHIMEKRGAATIAEVWPGLELFIHGGIGFEPYRAQYDAICPPGMRYLETYNASEGFFGIQTDPGDRSMTLMLDYGTFYEFMPLDQVGQEDPQGVVPLEGVRTGVDYAMVITSVNGLWRYMIGDTVRFTSRYPFRFVISGRTKLYINAFGEELMISNAEAAMTRACAETGAVARDYTAAPVFMDRDERGRHEWMVEFDTPPADTADFARRLDKALQDVNSDYEAKRYKDITLAAPAVNVAPRGLFDAWLRSKGKMGGQNKVPRLRNDRALMEELKQMAQALGGKEEV
ncbi:GH3 auxin-responsive promoter family protein, partial [Salmonella enterica]|nr:GH3 auxin-responsive promoter family protein [Salmonella enterica]